MGLFNYSVTVHSPDRSRSEEVSLLVDTGSVFTWIPASVLERLGVPRENSESFKLADSTILLRNTADVTIEIDGVRHVTGVVFGAPEDLLLLGALTLERFLLTPDVVNKRLVPTVAITGQIL